MDDPSHDGLQVVGCGLWVGIEVRCLELRIRDQYLCDLCVGFIYLELEFGGYVCLGRLGHGL
jgi:hypothetical protein